MIRVVIDTGIVISAAFRDRVPVELILFIAKSKDYEWVASSAIPKEYSEVLTRKKFGLSDEILSEWKNKFQLFTTLIESEVKIDFARDRKDAIFLECAMASDAKYFITGDKDFGDAADLLKASIISAAQFMSLVSN